MSKQAKDQQLTQLIQQALHEWLKADTVKACGHSQLAVIKWGPWTEEPETKQLIEPQWLVRINNRGRSYKVPTDSELDHTSDMIRAFYIAIYREIAKECKRVPADAIQIQAYTNNHPTGFHILFKYTENYHAAAHDRQRERLNLPAITE